MFEDIIEVEGTKKKCTFEKRVLEVHDANVMMDAKESYIKEGHGEVVARMFERSLRAMGIPMNVNFERTMVEDPECTRWTFHMKLDEEKKQCLKT